MADEIEPEDFWGFLAIPAKEAPMKHTTYGTERITAERSRQIEAEGWTPDHDDAHDKGEMAEAAACYALAVHDGNFLGAPARWPWDESWWKPSEDQIRNLEKAGALIAAEIDRLKRAERQSS